MNDKKYQFAVIKDLHSLRQNAIQEMEKDIQTLKQNPTFSVDYKNELEQNIRSKAQEKIQSIENSLFDAVDELEEQVNTPLSDFDIQAINNRVNYLESLNQSGALSASDIQNEINSVLGNEKGLLYMRGLCNEKKIPSGTIDEYLFGRFGRNVATLDEEYYPPSEYLTGFKENLDSGITTDVYFNEIGKRLGVISTPSAESHNEPDSDSQNPVLI